MSFPGTYNINYYYGDTLEFRVFPKNSSGEAFNLNNFTGAKFTLAPNKDTPVANQISCFAQIDSNQTSILCAIRPEDAANLIANDDGEFPRYVYDIEVSKPSNSTPYPIVYTLLAGFVSITRDVTKPGSGEEVAPEVSVPLNPTNLVLDSATDATLSVSWTAPTTGDAPTLYTFVAIPFTETLEDLRQAIQNSELATYDTTSGTTATITGLEADTEYSVVVRSTNSAGDASLETILFNSTAFSTTAVPPSVPSAPVINSINELDESLGVVITVPEDGGSPITNYKYSTDGTSFVAFDPAQTKPTAVTFVVTVQSVDGSNKYFIDGVDRPNLTLYKGVTYTFDQSDASNATHQIYLSETEDGTHGGGTEYTTGATYTGTAGTDGSLVFEVPENAPATLYYVCVNHSGMGVPAIISVEDFSLIISGLNNGTLYPVTIKAVNSVGDSDASNTVTGTPTSGAAAPTVPAAPTINSINPGDESLVVNFTAGGDGGSAITNYKYSIDGTNYIALDPETTTSPFTITGLTNDTSYPVTIKAVNAIGDSDSSNSVSETPVAPPPAPDFVVTNSGASSYLIDGVSNDTITLVRGETYVFDINAPGHPFWIQDSAGAYDEYAVYNNGITDNGIQVGTLTWEVSLSAPSTLYYVCQFHSSMQGIINIIDGGS